MRAQVNWFQCLWLRMRQWCGDASGQMVVELAVVIPVVLVVALIVLNLMGYIEACAAFDQAVPDTVIACGVSPAQEQDLPSALSSIQAQLTRTIGREARCEVEVSAAPLTDYPEGAPLTLSPLLTRFECTLIYRPWPQELRLPGISLVSPVALRHQRSFVVDRFRSGVVV